MSKKVGKIIQILSIVVGCLGAVASVIMAFSNVNNRDYLVLVAWIILAVMFIIAIYPLSAIGSLIYDIAEQREKVQLLSDKMKKYSKTYSDESPADKFSPSGRIRLQKFPQTSVRPGSQTKPGSDSSKVNVPKQSTDGDSKGDGKARPQTSPVVRITTEGDKKTTASDDFTRTLAAETLNDVPQESEEKVKAGAYSPRGMASTDNIAVLPSDTLKEAFRTSGTNSSRPVKFSTTTSLDTFEINRKTGRITKVIRNPSTTISAGGLHSAVVYSSGRVGAVGYSTYGQCDVSNWSNIISVSAGNHHTLGLRSDGRCVAAGYNGYGQCNVSEWVNVCQIATGFGHSVGLLEDGTCVATGDNAYGQCNVFDWMDIVSIVAGYNYTVGLRADGTIIAVGANTDGQWSAVKWAGISAVAAGGFHTVGLKNDGTCIAVGNNANDQCDVTRWTNVVSVAAGNYHSVALLANGTCVATGYNGYGQCDVSDWKNVVEIAAGRNHTLGLLSNGRVIAAGDNTQGQCNVQTFNGVKMPKNNT